MAVLFSSSLGDIGVFLVTCLVVLYLYFTRNFKYWEKRGARYMKPMVVVGNIGKVIMQKETLAQYLKRVYDLNPDAPVVGIFAFQKPILMLRSLDLVRSVLVKDAGYFLDRTIGSENGTDLASRSLFMLKGKKWRHMRVKLTPTFTSGKIKKMFYLINECGKELVQCVDHEMSKRKSVLVKETVARYSTDVIASCAFGVNANALADPDSEFRATMKKVFEFKGTKKLTVLFAVVAPRLGRLLQLKNGDGGVATFVRKTFWDVVNYRKKNGVVRKDFVDILMQIKNEGEVRAEDAKDMEEIKHDSRYMNTDTAKSEKSDIKLVDDDFVAQAFIFILAGFETSSSVITFCMYELAMNPDVQDRLRREIQTVLEKHNNEATYEAIVEMTYLEMVVSETLRKYPTVPQLERKCLQDYKIPGTEIVVEKGTSVMIPVLGIHWDPTIYPEPVRFDPERFSPENKSKLPNFAHIPFGEGPRICIGMRFGQMQVKTALVHILTSYQVMPCADTPPYPLEMRTSSGSNAPKKDIILTFQKIK